MIIRIIYCEWCCAKFPIVYCTLSILRFHHRWNEFSQFLPETDKKKNIHNIRLILSKHLIRIGIHSIFLLSAVVSYHKYRIRQQIPTGLTLHIEPIK